VDETVWLNQAQLCELFDKNKRTISEHIRNIFKEGELPDLSHPIISTRCWSASEISGQANAGCIYAFGKFFAIAADYEPSLAETTRFFSIIQNKLHYATTGMTAAELITGGADYVLRRSMDA
jgi:hypothetical protein